MALKQLIARRGRVFVIYLDNAKAFVDRQNQQR